MIAWILANKRLVAVGIAALCLFFSGWAVNGWRYEIKIQDLSLANDKAIAAATAEAEAKESALTARIADIDKQHMGNLQNAYAEIEKLRGRLASGASVMRVVATCGDLSRPSASSGLDNAACPRLTRASEQDYLSLRRSIEGVTAQLKACQEILKQDAR